MSTEQRTRAEFGSHFGVHSYIDDSDRFRAEIILSLYRVDHPRCPVYKLDSIRTVTIIGDGLDIELAEQRWLELKRSEAKNLSNTTKKYHNMLIDAYLDIIRVGVKMGHYASPLEIDDQS